jgi:hypothetical protein
MRNIGILALMASTSFSSVTTSFPLPSPHVLREYVLPLALFACALVLPILWIAVAYIVIGQAHFLMAFLYQGRAGKMRRSQYLALAALSIAVLLWYFKEVALATPMFITAAIAFGTHFAVDEFFLHKETLTWRKQLTVAAFVILYSALVLAYVYPALHVLALIGTGLAVLLMLARAVSKVRPSSAERYLSFITILLIGLSVVLKLPEQVLAVIILLHCANWCIAYAIKVRSNPDRSRRYWTDTAVTLVASSLLFTLSGFAAFSVFKFLFLPMYWDGWAIAHFVLSSRFASGPQAPLG